MQKHFVPAIEIKTTKVVKFFGQLPIVTTSEDGLVKHKISLENLLTFSKIYIFSMVAFAAIVSLSIDLHHQKRFYQSIQRIKLRNDETGNR